MGGLSHKKWWEKAGGRQKWQNSCRSLDATECNGHHKQNVIATNHSHIFLHILHIPLFRDTKPRSCWETAQPQCYKCIPTRFFRVTFLGVLSDLFRVKWPQFGESKGHLEEAGTHILIGLFADIRFVPSNVLVAFGLPQSMYWMVNCDLVRRIFNSYRVTFLWCHARLTSYYVEPNRQFSNMFTRVLGC